MTKFKNAALIAAVAAAFGAAAPAHAGTGCNGVINPFVWGCAPWDNNNGPQFPYYKKKVVEIPRQGTQIVTQNGAQVAVRDGVRYPMVAAGGGNVIAPGGANMVAAGGGNLKVWAQ